MHGNRNGQRASVEQHSSLTSQSAEAPPQSALRHRRFLTSSSPWPAECVLQANAELAVREMLVAFSQEQGLPQVRAGGFL